MRKRTNNINQKSLTKSNTSRPSKKSQSRNKQTTVVQSKSKTKNSQKYNVYKKEGHVSKSKSKSKSREYSCILKGNKNKIQITSSLLIKKDSLQINDQRKDLKIEFQKAVTKVFHVLDIFSRGSISEANINRWVPEAALYFLGSVFQKIRVFRIVMNEPQFKQQCYKIFVKSSDEDILQFIQNIKKHDNFNEQKISFQGDQKQTIQSQVEDRFCFQLQSGQTSFRKINIGQKTMPLQTIKSNQIYFDDDEENRQENKQEFRNKVKQNIQKSKQNKQKGEKNKISPLSHFNSFQNVAVKNKDKKVIDAENMPLKVVQKQNSSKMKNNLNNVASGSQSPFFKGSVTSVLTKLGPQKKDSVDRIDKLSLRLQDYIKQNAARLQRSKNCRIQL